MSDLTEQIVEAIEDALSEEYGAAEKDALLGYVQRARWGEWEAICTVARCGWHQSRGNRTREDAVLNMRGHANLVHPPRIPVYRTTPPDSTAGSDA